MPIMPDKDKEAQEIDIREVRYETVFPGREVLPMPAPTPISTTTWPQWFCKRCEHTWIGRQQIPPVACPRCHSGYWNTEIGERGREDRERKEKLEQARKRVQRRERAVRGARGGMGGRRGYAVQRQGPGKAPPQEPQDGKELEKEQ